MIQGDQLKATFSFIKELWPSVGQPLILDVNLQNANHCFTSCVVFCMDKLEGHINRGYSIDHH